MPTLRMSIEWLVLGHEGIEFCSPQWQESAKSFHEKADPCQ